VTVDGTDGMDGTDRPAPGGDWARYPVAAQDEHPGRTAVGDDGLPLRDEPPTPVVRLGALCGLRRSGADDATTQSFWVSEVATLADGRRVVLHDERGFTVGARGARPDLRRGLTRESLVRDVLTVVLPDDDVDEGDDHPWGWLAERCRARGLAVSADDLRALPYDVVLTDDLLRWLDVGAER
jgi:hypothetical protein